MKILPWLSSWNLRGRDRSIVPDSRRRRQSLSRHSVSTLGQTLEQRTLLTTFTVDSLLDAVDANPGDGVADDGSGNVTLRAAIQEANALAGDDDIILPAGVIQLSIAGTLEDAAATGDLDITQDLTITGAGAGVTFIDFNDLDRIFDVHAGAMVTVSDVTIREGNVVSSNEDGGGIRNSGTLTIEDSVLTDLSALGGGAVANTSAGSLTIRRSTLSLSSASGTVGGGGLLNAGTVVVEESTVDSNGSVFNGGGIANLGAAADLTLTDTTVRGNVAPTSTRDGGGLYNINGTVEIVGSTFSGNRARNGAGFWTGGGASMVTLTNSTLSGNLSAFGRGGGLYVDQDNDLVVAEFVTLTANTAQEGGGAFIAGGGLTAANSILADNVGLNSAPEISGTFSSLGYNLLGAFLVAQMPGDVVTSDPMLDVLADNGGPTQTHALQPGSPAIDNADPMSPLILDQRGLLRPRDFDGDGSDEPDMGAFEVNPPTLSGGAATDLRLIRNGDDLELRDDSDDSLIDSTPWFDGGSVTIDGSADDDTLTIDFSAGNVVPAGGLTFNGGAQRSGGDTLVLESGTYETITHTFANASDGTITLDDGSDARVVTYTGLEPITDNLAADDRVFDFGASSDDVTLSDGAAAADGLTRIASVSSSETVDFATPTTSVTINTAAGDDTVTLDGVDSTFSGDVRVNTGDDADTVDASLFSQRAIATGGNGNDSLTGSAFDDNLTGNGGDDVLDAGDGNDVLNGGSGKDELLGGIGDDLVQGQGGTGDTLDGGDGDDTLNGGSGNDVIRESFDSDVVLTNSAMTGRGTDTIISAERASLTGGAADQSIDVSALFTMGLTSATLNGAGGNDSLVGTSGSDVLVGAGGSDLVDGGSGHDRMFGGAGSDTLIGGAGDDFMKGLGSSGDRLTGGDGDDTLNGGRGVDRLIESADVDFTLTNMSLTGVGTDVVQAIEVAELNGGASANTIDVSAFLGFKGFTLIRGNGGDDFLIGSAGPDVLNGGDGNDTLQGKEGNDVLNGGDGNDGITGHDGNDEVNAERGFDVVYGGNGDDTLLGGNAVDTLIGGSGDDSIGGGAGVDTLVGGTGNNDASVGDTISDATANIDEAFTIDPLPSWVDQV
ncbi:MAG: choice-of-anchor Q domain-containing protein [Planctomycetota bacterium]|jgi:Ca2+-binding RTX toxin-like protein